MKKEVFEEDLPKLFELTQSEKTPNIYEGAIGIRKLLSTKKPPTTLIIDLGIHKQLIRLTDHSSAHIRLETCWSLANIANGDNG
jgi:hypothetical protein